MQLFPKCIFPKNRLYNHFTFCRNGSRIWCRGMSARGNLVRKKIDAIERKAAHSVNIHRDQCIALFTYSNHGIYCLLSLFINFLSTSRDEAVSTHNLEKFSTPENLNLLETLMCFGVSKLKLSARLECRYSYDIPEYPSCLINGLGSLFSVVYRLV